MDPGRDPARRARWRRLGVAVVLAGGLAVGGCTYSTESSLQREGVESFLPTTTTVTETPAPTAPAPGPSEEAADPLTNASAVSVRGIGSVRFGMTVGQAVAAGGFALEADGPIEDADCYEVHPVGGPAGLRFTIAGGVVARLDVLSGPIATVSGLGIGTTEEQIVGAFPGQVAIEPRSGASGHRLVFTPGTRGDEQRRVIWETDGARVVHFRAGSLPTVDATRPCS